MGGLILEVDVLDASPVSDHGEGVLEARHQVDAETDVAAIHTVDLGEAATAEDAAIRSRN